MKAVPIRGRILLCLPATWAVQRHGSHSISHGGQFSTRMAASAFTPPIFSAAKKCRLAAVDALEGLVATINNCRIWPLGALVRIGDFESLAEWEQRYLVGGCAVQRAPLKPYMLAFQHCIAEVARRTKEGRVSDFVFEQQKEFAPKSLELVEEIRKRLPPEVRPRIGKCVFACKEEVGPPLEAADLLSHLWFARKQLSDNMGEAREFALRELTKTIDWRYRYDRKEFDALLNALSDEQRAALRDEVKQ